ncbi:type II toxin-antitoxin system RelE/ParE family toxin [Pelagerythrobacter sp.]|uniref:type II toxin-antitoxin system RelE family toxin n=1 Tax=Pelagerythrobacter sp. TaxID=2800702 RepID=UPI0035B0B895
MPIYEVEFRPRAARAFEKLGHAEKRQFARKLDERRRNPHVPGDAFRGIPDAYLLKLRSSGLRLVYQVQDDVLVILVLAVGRRDREEAYKNAIREFGKLGN